MSKLACIAVLIPTLLLSSSLILQVHTICKCDAGPRSCPECSCESDGGACQLLNRISNLQQCRRELVQMLCLPANQRNEDPLCIINDNGNCQKCDCNMDNQKCKQLDQDCIAPRNRSCSNLQAAIAACTEDGVDCCTDDTTESTDDSSKPTHSKSNMTVVIMAVLISLVVVILIAIASVTLICYWRYKLKLTRERLGHTAHESMQENVSYNVAQQSQVLNSDPLYSVLDGETSGRYTHTQALPAISSHNTQPPKLPTSRRPYYEEIDSDFKETSTSAATPTEYEQPVKETPTKTLSKPLNENSTRKNEVDDYQEPADALKITPQEEEEKQDTQKTNTTNGMSAYQEPPDALRTDNPQPSQEEEEKQDRWKT